MHNLRLTSERQLAECLRLAVASVTGSTDKGWTAGRREGRDSPVCLRPPMEPLEAGGLTAVVLIRSFILYQRRLIRLCTYVVCLCRPPRDNPAQLSHFVFGIWFLPLRSFGTRLVLMLEQNNGSKQTPERRRSEPQSDSSTCSGSKLIRIL